MLSEWQVVEGASPVSPHLADTSCKAILVNDVRVPASFDELLYEIPHALIAACKCRVRRSIRDNQHPFAFADMIRFITAKSFI
jgi:hypothetical protein